MGYIKHHTIVVTGDEFPIMEAHAIAEKIFQSDCSPIIRASVNGYQSFFIAPDGSKEGWEESDQGDLKRGEFIKLIKKLNRVDFAEMTFGDDAGKPKIGRYSK